MLLMSEIHSRHAHYRQTHGRHDRHGGITNITACWIMTVMLTYAHYRRDCRNGNVNADGINGRNRR